MLTKRQTTMLNGECIIDNIMVAGYSAELNSNDPSDIRFSYWINDSAMYKDHREEARADQAAFEDFAYSVQDDMLAKITEATE